MALSPAIMDPVLKSWLARGIEISLHTADPGPGGAAEAAGRHRFPLNLSNCVVARGQIVTRTNDGMWFNTFSQTTATHFGLWLGSQFIGGGKLAVPVRLSSTNSAYNMLAIKAGTVILSFRER